MPSAVDIVLADAQATPVNHTFIPLGPDSSGVFWWEDQSQASAAGYWRISAKITRPKTPAAGQPTNGRNIKVSIVMSEPILEVVSNSTVSGIAPSPVISYVPKAALDFILPERSSLAARKDLRKMFANLLANAQVIGMVEDLKPVY